MASAGYSGTPLPRKLGLNPDTRLYFHAAPSEFSDWLGPLPDGAIRLAKPAKPIDLAVLFFTRAAELTKVFTRVAKLLAQDGAIWIAWPKKAAKVATDLDENRVRESGLAIGLVDVKVCAVSEIWSGLKFVVRVKDRKN